MRDRGRARAGFTLIELLVSIALGVMLLGIVAVTFARVSTVFNMAMARLEAVQNGRVALDMLERDLAGATIDATGNSFVGVADANALFGAPAKAGGGWPGLWFTTTSAGQSRPGGKVVYFCADALGAFDSNANRMLRYVDTNVAQPGSTPVIGTPNETMVAYGVVRCRIDYLDRSPAQSVSGGAGAWVQSWNSQSGGAQEGEQPSAVLVHVELTDRQGRLLKQDQLVVMERVIWLETRGINE
jgi:prepilin-type N-terminal cleavage/methylation domain-containing protein